MFLGRHDRRATDSAIVSMEMDSGAQVVVQAGGVSHDFDRTGVPVKLDRDPHYLIADIIGTSWWTEMMYLPSLKSHLEAELVAICGRDRERARDLAKVNSIPQVFSDYRRLIGDAQLDAVVVATPDDLHFPMTMVALEAGLHVLCEKPIANNVDDARRMQEGAKAAGVKNMVLFTWRWQPHWQHLKRLIDEGYIGRCHQARFAFDGGQARQHDHTWRTDGARSNGMV